MSIVAAMMFPDSGLVIYADKRVVKRYGGSTETTDDFVKIHYITETTVCGITGFGQWGISLIRTLQLSGESLASKLIEIIENYSHPTHDLVSQSTVTFGGIYDNGKPFLWTRQTDTGVITLDQNEMSYSLAMSPEDLSDECSKYMLDEMYASSNPHLTLQKTILYASERRHEYISPTYDCIVVPYKS